MVEGYYVGNGYGAGDTQEPLHIDSLFGNVTVPNDDSAAGDVVAEQHLVHQLLQ